MTVHLVNTTNDRAWKRTMETVGRLREAGCDKLAIQELGEFITANPGQADQARAVIQEILIFSQLPPQSPILLCRDALGIPQGIDGSFAISAEHC